MTGNTDKSERSDAVLIVGAGIGGMQSALLLAEAGHRVYLVDGAPGIMWQTPQESVGKVRSKRCSEPPMPGAPSTR